MDIEQAADLGGDFFTLHTGITDGVVELGVGLVELEADLFEHALGIGAEDGVLAPFHHDLVELVGVGEVEISHHHEGAGGPGGAAHVGMEGSLAEISTGAVAEVAHINLTGHFELAFDGRRIVFKGDELFAFLMALLFALVVDAAGDALHVLTQPLKDLADALDALGAALAEHVGESGRHVELAAADAEAVLAAVAHLLHQRLEGIEAVKGVAIFGVIVAERLFKPHDGNAALMPNRVAHW